MKTTIKKTFLDIQKEEEWLNEQGERGLMLMDYHNGEYEFEDVSPAKYQYKIDLPDYTGSKKKDYFSFLEHSGICVVADYGGRAYLRKNTAYGPLELYTENNDIRKYMSKRYSHFFTIGISQLTGGLAMLVQTLYDVKPEGVPFYIAMVFEIGLMISGIIFLIMGIQKHKKNTFMSKDEKDIWE